MTFTVFKNINNFHKICIGIAAVILFFVFLFSPFDFSPFSGNVLSAQTSKPSVTVINPIRGPQLGLEHADLLASLKGQWQVTKDANVSATWLWQYSALENQDMVTFAKKQMQKQEFGIFLEIDRNLAGKANVLYRGRGPWYFSDGLLLISYDIYERERLIDTVFAKFKKTFGYYPKSVGAWWVGADSLSYMNKKYGVIASLQVADQFDLDTYSVWGTPWSIPYVSSSQDASVPAASLDKSSHVVVMQWAPRDPTEGYGSAFANSTFSMQDYPLKKYDSSYASYLMDIFLHGSFDQVVIGLEAGAPAQSYSGFYKTHLLLAKKLEQQQKAVIQTAGDFATKFFAGHTLLASTSYMLSQGYHTQDQSFWFNSVKYRVGIQKTGDEIFLVDLRDYSKGIPEDFSLLPNSQGFLRITNTALIDSARFPQDKLPLAHTKDKMEIAENNGEILLSSGNKQIARVTQDTLFLPQLSQSFIFKTPRDFGDISFILFISLVFYTILLFILYTKKKHVVLHFYVLTCCLLIAYPFMSHSDVHQATFLFDRKQLVLLPFLNLLPFALPIRFIILFQILPFLLLIISHLIFMFWGIGKRYAKYYYGVVLVFFILLYSHVPNFVVETFILKKKGIVIAGVGVYVLLAVIVCFLLLYKSKSREKFIKVLSVALLGLVITVSTLFFSWQKYAITPFELNSLMTIHKLHKDVLYIMPKEKPIYHEIVPLLLENDQMRTMLTNTNWQQVIRPEGKFLTFDNLDNKIIFVPRYLGADLYREEIEKYKLRKIFDNAQIALFSQ